ncbi:DUF1573 domain-containing protein [Candidatus Gottesmanbacteria bacterium]|nr:DUF1573 domain-containing protein [Candidatus Gottesmanbacteria bacterium]
MKFKFFLLFAVALGLLAIFGYFQAVGRGTPPDQKTSKPKIVVEPEQWDFGEIEYGKIAEYTFKVRNTGSETLEIKRVATSCACTSAKIDKEKIGPGGTAEILVTYDTAAMGRGSHGKGKQERIIYVKSNDPENPQVQVKIYANIY